MTRVKAPARPDNALASPRRSALARDVAMRMAATEYARGIAALEKLSAEDWDRPTACTGWDVRAMACHMLGMMDLWTSFGESRRQIGSAKRAGGVFIDALTDQQVRERATLTPDQILERMRTAAARAAAFRQRMPAALRRWMITYDGPIGPHPTSPTERWTMGYLCDVITTRDPWMHRVDIAMATRTELHLTADHDGLLIGDAVTEWASRHGQPVNLVLTGPAGGSWTWGSGGPSLEVDAIEFCRTVTGRKRPAEGLLATDVPF